MSTVAVLIPTYKPSWYLQRCLQSIEEQTLPKDNFKVYIALNGPKDNFEEVIHSALDSTNFDYEFFYLEQAGVSNARNHLINNSTEPYITFVDDDDVLSSNYLEGLLSVTFKNTMGICDVRKFTTSLEDACPNFIGIAFNKLNDTERSHFKVRKFFSSPWAKMLHRGMIGNVRFDEQLANGEDSLFMASISKNIVAVKKAPLNSCYYVYERENSASRKKPIITTEVRRISYITSKYLQLFFRRDYDKIFILTRVLATFKNLKRFLY